jgi:methionyl-tRNA synthetase
MKPFYISTAISYPNGAPHIGHAYEAIATDVIARFRKLEGYDVRFSTGTDDHGQKMYQTARGLNKTPLELADELTPAFKNMGLDLGCEPDDFIRTSELRHHASVQALWKRIAANGDIYKDSYAGWYSVRDEAFYTEGELVKGDDGAFMAPTGTPVEWVEEESYFFRLSAYQDQLLDIFEQRPEFIQPEARRNEIMQFVRGGLKDLSISRTSFDWGVPVPDDPAHVIYVWLDALTNYITSIGFPDEDGDMWKSYWPASLHVIGKDITRFHAVYWPAFLLSAGIELPKEIFAHGFLTVRGEKMSKSLGNVLSPEALLSKYGSDAVRFFFMREVPFGRDGSFSDEAIVLRVNADLANDLGNLAQRSLSMIQKNLSGELSEPSSFSEQDKKVLQGADALHGLCVQAMRGYEIHTYLSALFDHVSLTNKYFADEAPWGLKKTDPERMATILYVAAEVVRQAAILLQPVCALGASRLLDALAIPHDQRGFDKLGEAGRLSAKQNLPAPEPAFPRLEMVASETGAAE